MVKISKEICFPQNYKNFDIPKTHDNYKLVNQELKTGCTPNCLSCKIYNSLRCSVCAIGYSIYNGLCISKKEYCIENVPNCKTCKFDE